MLLQWVCLMLAALSCSNASRAAGACKGARQQRRPKRWRAHSATALSRPPALAGGLLTSPSSPAARY